MATFAKDVLLKRCFQAVCAWRVFSSFAVIALILLSGCHFACKNALLSIFSDSLETVSMWIKRDDDW